MIWVVQRRDDLTPFFTTLDEATIEPLDGRLKTEPTSLAARVGDVSATPATEMAMQAS